MIESAIAESGPDMICAASDEWLNLALVVGFVSPERLFISSTRVLRPLSLRGV